MTPEALDDFETLFGRRGACDGCWCMWPLQTAREFAARAGDTNRGLMRERVAAGEVPGLLAYVGREAVGWCGLAPRERYGRIERSRMLRRPDTVAVWSLVCFYVRPDHRGQGLTRALIAAAAAHAAARGANWLEAYPVDRGAAAPAGLLWHGTADTFRAAGFVQVACHQPGRPLMRLRLAPPR